MPSTDRDADSSASPRIVGQPSRKGKKAWRKNTDISSVTTGLAAAREEILQTGGHTFSDLPSDALFQTETTGFAAHGKEQWHRKIAHAPTKADEVIGARSKIPALGTHRKTEEQGVGNGGLVSGKRKRNAVSRAELERLKKFAYTNGKAVQPEVMQTSEGATYDPWAGDEDRAPPQSGAERSFIAQRRPLREPVTLRRPPTAMTTSGKPVPNVHKPAAGRSYNPAFPEWSALIERAGEKEVDAEKRRLQKEQEEREQEVRARAAAREVERQEKEAAEAGVSDYESEWEGFQSEADETGKSLLSAKRPRRKTPAERNRVIRRKQAEALEKHEAKRKEREKQERRIDEIRKEMERQRELQEWEGFGSEAESADEVEAEDDVLKRKKGSRTGVPDAPLDLLLAEDLQDSLRRLRPEGNPLRDRFRNVMVQGKMEARRPINQPKKPRRDVTEKWSYKDWKLPRTESTRA